MISRPALGGTALQSSPSRLISWILTACAVLALCLHAVAAQAQAADPKGEPNKFVESVGNQALQVVKESDAIRKGDRAAILAAVNENIMPYVNLEKTTRLSAGRYWRQASPEQRQKLVDAFKGTLVRTYSGALSRVDDKTQLTILPFRGDANADDVVVRSSLTQPNGGPVGVETLAAALSEQRDVIEDVIEPYLVQKGLLQRTPRGRMVSEKGFKYLGLTPKSNQQSGLFSDD